MQVAAAAVTELMQTILVVVPAEVAAVEMEHEAEQLALVL
jgi:hypothetical protein